MKEQNKFYTSISKFYSEIFPFKPVQFQFVKENLGEIVGKKILDIGCATGELAFQLARSRAKVIGIDLNEDLLNQAKQNNNHKTLTFQRGDMLELEKDFQGNQFDAVLCFGNTLVHLESKELVRKMLKETNKILKPGGKFLIQILNYDYILNERVTELPIIETGNIKFIRNYKFQDNSLTIRFETHLEIKSENKIVSNETNLLALRSENLKQLLKDVGFSDIHLFGNFKLTQFGGKHLPLVLSCIK